MLSQTSEHAIRALLLLARHPAGERVPADRIAAALGAPANYLAKTLRLMVKCGLLDSSRGPAGGFSLRKPPGRISVAEVIDLFTDARPASTCLLGDRPCDGANPCAVHGRWALLRESTRAPLRDTTIADLLGTGAGRLGGEITEPAANAA